jgi:disulfide bond formation protein DsbB
MSNRFGFLIAHLNILTICAVLVGAFVVQFGQGEFPCPLCVLQRMAMMLCALGPAYVIMKARAGEVKTTDFATGYGMSVIAAVAGAFISIRQILLHIVPPDLATATRCSGYTSTRGHCSSSWRRSSPPASTWCSRASSSPEGDRVRLVFEARALAVWCDHRRERGRGLC